MLSQVLYCANYYSHVNSEVGVDGRTYTFLESLCYADFNGMQHFVVA